MEFRLRSMLEIVEHGKDGKRLGGNVPNVYREAINDALLHLK